MSCLKRLEQQFEQAAWSPDEVPDEFQQRRGKADLQLTSFAWLSPLGSEARCAYLCGPRAEILNLMVYPRNCQEVPVLAVELILFGQQPRVAVIDLQPVQGLSAHPALGRRLRDELGPCHAELSQGLSEGGELPPWAMHHFTPWAIFSRPRSMAELPLVLQAFERYLDLWLGRFYPEEKAVFSDELALRHYQHHHRQNTPGRRFLVTSFGSQWTEDYLGRFMYPDGQRVPA